MFDSSYVSIVNNETQVRLQMRFFKRKNVLYKTVDEAPYFFHIVHKASAGFALHGSAHHAATQFPGPG